MHKPFYIALTLTGILLFLMLQTGSAQMFFISDTLELKVFTIEQPREKMFDVGSRRFTADTTLLDINQGNAASEVLNALLPVNIKTFGSSGALSTFSLRGAGGSRSLVTWNGMQLNSLTTGDVNLSLLNSSAFNSLSVNYSSPSTLYGGNSFGGVLELTSEPEFDRGLRVSAMAKSGSFNTGFQSGSVSFSNKKFATNSTIWGFSSKNDFKYFDQYYNRQMNRINGNHNSCGIITNSSFRIATHQMVTAGIWYQENLALLPTINGSNPYSMPSQQYDKSTRGYMKWRFEKGKIYASVNGYFTNELLLYKQKVLAESADYSIYSATRPLKTGGDADIRYQVNHWLLTDVGISYFYNRVSGSNFPAIPSEKQLALFSALKVKTSAFNAVLSARKEIHTLYNPPLRFAIGGEYLPWQDLKLRLNVSQKFRVPTFNDKFWPLSGNPNLKPEKGTTYETGVAFSKRLNRLKLEAEATLFRNNIKNLLTWLPSDESALWVPVNYAEVTSKGLESSIVLSYAFSANLLISQNLAADINSSVQSGSSQQLLYTPKYRAGSTTRITYRKISTIFSMNYLSRRRFEDSNRSLSEFYSSSLKTMYKFRFYDIAITLWFELNNAFNQVEPYVKDYPVPGRNYLAGLSIGI